MSICTPAIVSLGGTLKKSPVMCTMDKAHKKDMHKAFSDQVALNTDTKTNVQDQDWFVQRPSVCCNIVLTDTHWLLQLLCSSTITCCSHWPCFFNASPSSDATIPQTTSLRQLWLWVTSAETSSFFRQLPRQWRRLLPAVQEVSNA